MADTTDISWCDATFNPWIGCAKISLGCDNCYAATQDKFRKWTPEGWGGQRKRTSDANWKVPLQWNRSPFYECLGCGNRLSASSAKQGEWMKCGRCGGDRFKDARRRVFCASLADVFDNEVTMQWRVDLLDLIAETPNLDWLLLTKRIGNASRMINEALIELGNGTKDLLPSWPWPNVWIGATIVNQEEADRDIPKLLATPAAVRFLSMEPLLGPVDLHGLWSARTGARKAIAGPIPRDYCGFINWVIVGGESGPGARPMHPAWARSLRDQCAAAGVPFHFKQHGEWLPTAFCTNDQAVAPHQGVVYVSRDGTVKDGADGIDFFGGDEETAKVGKKAAGRLLDGVTHDAFPEVQP